MTLPWTQTQVFTSYDHCQQFIRQFGAVHNLPEQELTVLLDLFPEPTDFDALTLGDIMERLTSHSPPFSDALVEQLWLGMKKIIDTELFPSTYDKGLAFGRFALSSMLYSRPRVLVIFSAVDQETSSEVVVKIALEADRTLLLRNEQDLLTGVLMGCAGVPQIMQAGSIEVLSGKSFSRAWAIVMKPFGTPLWDVQERQFPLMTAEDRQNLLLGWAYRLPSILKDIHARGIIHSDIKPDNIIMTSTGALTIIDFDLAIPLSEAETRTENMGTREFGPPSIWRDNETVSEETDFVSLVYTLQALEMGVLEWLEANRNRAPFDRSEPVPGSAASVALSLYLQQRERKREEELKSRQAPVPCSGHPPLMSYHSSSSHRRSGSTSSEHRRQGRKRPREGLKDIIVLDQADDANEELPEGQIDLKRRHSQDYDGNISGCDSDGSTHSHSSTHSHHLEKKQAGTIIVGCVAAAPAAPFPPPAAELAMLLERYAEERARVWRLWHSQPHERKQQQEQGQQQQQYEEESLPGYETADLTLNRCSTSSSSSSSSPLAATAIPSPFSTTSFASFAAAAAAASVSPTSSSPPASSTAALVPPTSSSSDVITIATSPANSTCSSSSSSPRTLVVAPSPSTPVSFTATVTAMMIMSLSPLAVKSKKFLIFWRTNVLLSLVVLGALSLGLSALWRSRQRVRGQ